MYGAQVLTEAQVNIYCSLYTWNSHFDPLSWLNSNCRFSYTVTSGMSVEERK